MPRHGASGLATSAATESAGGGRKAAPASAQTKKRVALGNVTNVAGACQRGRRAGGSGKVARASANTAKLNSASSAETVTEGWPASTLTAQGSAVKSASAKPANAASRHGIATEKQDVHPTEDCTIVHVSNIAPGTAYCSSNVSRMYPGDSVSIGEAMPTCDSIKSPDFECIGDGDSPRITSLQLRANAHQHVVEARDETKCATNAPAAMEIDQVCDAGNNDEDPQLCPNRSSDIYTFLREAETKTRPSTDFMEKIQKDVTSRMRAILIDWLVEVADEYRLVPDTLYLTVNYIDRYLSGNKINHQRLQLLGIACMLIAAKREEICAPQVEEFCYITDNSYFRNEVLEMESAILKHLNYEMSAPTAKCFLRRFVPFAQSIDEDQSFLLEPLANYAAELSLLEYNLLSYRPSLIAASAIFLAKFILLPAKKPWDSMLACYTQYNPSELCNCVKELHRLFSGGPGVNLHAIREKYSQHKYKFVAKSHCPPSIPEEYFLDAAYLE